jgi:hypothetical protein
MAVAAEIVQFSQRSKTKNHILHIKFFWENLWLIVALLLCCLRSRNFSCEPSMQLHNKISNCESFLKVQVVVVSDVVQKKED